MRRGKEKKATLLCFTLWMLIAMTAIQGNLSSEEVNGKTLMNPESFMNIPHETSLRLVPAMWDKGLLLSASKLYRGPCTLGRLTMLMPSLQRWLRKDLQSLTSDCDSKSLPLSKTEYMALVASLAEVTALAVHNSRNLNSLACALTKSLNSTSQALDALNQELRQVKDATLENRAAIDYLLLRHNHGCKEFHSMCCFNLTEQTELIENDIRHRKEVAQNIRVKESDIGYCSEEYEILTEDGYYLNVNRIPGGNKSAILLMHGLAMEGSVWISNLPHQSLGFILADAGYDVWIGNSRGNFWSRRHKHLSVNETEFWNFSFHEMGIYDLTAMTEFILQKTGQQKIFYAGHAVGSAIAYVAFSVLPHLAEKIKLFFALGPAYTLQKAISPIVQILRLPEVLIKLIFGKKEFVLLNPRQRTALTQQCRRQPADELCKQALSLIGGFNLKNLNKSRSDVYISHFPDYTSVKHIIHLGQLMKSGLFRYFDYGSKNIDIYNQTTPPFYRIEAITMPVAMWSGGQDWVCQPMEIAQLRFRTTNVVYYKEFPDWTHWDFIWGIDAHQRAYKVILGLMKKYR